MSENIDKIIRVGSRKSELALIQTKHVISRLQKLFPEKKFEIHTMTTIGDRVLNVSLPKIGEKSLFTRDLEDALRNGGVDFVVHSLKDLPTALPAGMAIGAVLEREDSRDALVVNEKYKGKTIGTLPAGCVIGTSSLRRTAQLRRQYPHLEVCDIRGNLNTRLAKLDAPNSKYSGIILAQAGLLRMGWMNRITQVLDPTDLLYAVGQGALAVECRSNDFEILEMLQKLMCLKTTCRILAERSFLKTLGGGCSAPVAVWTKLNGTVENNNKDELLLDITGAVWSLDGKIEIREANDCCLNLKRKILIQDKDNDEEDEDVSPRKRVKDHDRGDIGGNKKQTSPKVVDDDQFPINLSAGDSKNLVPDLKHLIDVHGELFKKCPFYALHQKDQENGNSSTKKDECPLKIPVGQDFMGKCPYVDTEQKIDLSEQFGGKCPITGNLLTDIERSHDNHKTNKDETDNSVTQVPSKCPFSSAGVAKKSSDNNNESKAENIGDSRRLSHESCPFLQKNIKLIDYELANKDQQNNKMLELIDDSDELFCGLYRHKCYNLDIFAKCEDLGKKLAENLIQKGALDVMKCAQQEIREKI